MALADDLEAAWKLIEPLPVPFIALAIVVFGGGWWLGQLWWKRQRDIQAERIDLLKERNDNLARLVNDAPLRAEFVAMQQSPSKKIEIPGKPNEWSKEQKERSIIFYRLQDSGLGKVEVSTTATTVAASPTASQLWDDLKAMQRKDGK